ncbi:MAG: hybrid sensor histidine kinase/response regulator transcription factor [Candidatus Cohnella colombiensis]|uniref:histidine kinase n=1 Tax=Candidatus Cohnella colombiensis TaxID=3121368 RepID=A0AA95JFZ6_9BACL|nr:MAG: hybrid sensor histidine kinase/response regulator transcription factor [Cohnella sp.]
MVRWIKVTCFSNLELESQKNRLIAFLLFGPLFVMAEVNISSRYSFFDPVNYKFLLFTFLFFGLTLSLLFVSSMQRAFKYITISMMLLLSMYELFLFNETLAAYQIMYINLALALIYLNGYLIMFTGIATAVCTAFGYIFWKDSLFPLYDSFIINVSIIIVLQVTIVLWGAAKIGIRFHHYVDHNQQMRILLKENEDQLLEILDKNRALAQYAKQVEQLTILEERNRISRELHDTIGHTFTSIIAGLEVLRLQADPSEEAREKRMETLLRTARKGLEDIRDHVHQSDKLSDSQLLHEHIERLAAEMSQNTGADILFHMEGEAVVLQQQHQIALLRCAQEAMTNAIRHGQAKRVDIRLVFNSDKVQLEIVDDGSGIDMEKLQYGFGLNTMKERIEALRGTLQLFAEPFKGVRVDCRLPLINHLQKNNIKLLLVDDQDLIAESFRILLSMEHDFEVMGIATNGKSAIEFCESNVPDVILMDIHMPLMNGVDATRSIKQRWPNVKVIILTTFQDVHHAAEAISLGAEGFLLKSIQPRYLAEGIRIVSNGGTLISMETAKLLVEDRNEQSRPDRSVLDQGNDKDTDENRTSLARENRMFSLNDKEIEIVRYLSEGLKYKDIAQKLHFSESTIKNYVSIIYSKLNVDNRMQAVKKVQEEMLLSRES